MGSIKLLGELLLKLALLAINSIAKGKRDDIKNDPLSAFDRKFGSVRDSSKPVQQANDRKEAERENAHSERS